MLGLNPSIRIYRYSKGQYFDCHCTSLQVPLSCRSNTPWQDDESNDLNLTTKATVTPVKTTWTLLLYLTSPTTGCHGGETVFYPDDGPGKKSVLPQEVVISLETGMLLLHRHGNDCMLVSLHRLEFVVD